MTLWKILRVHSELESCQTLKSQYSDDLDHIQSDEIHIDQDMANQKVELVKGNKAITKNEKEFDQKYKQQVALGPQLISAKEKKKKLEKKLAEQETMGDNMAKEKKVQKATLNRLEADIAKLTQTESEIDQQLNGETAALTIVSFLHPSI